MSRSECENIRNNILSQFNEYFSENDSFVIGVSGGADSMALLHCMHTLGISALVVHINYGLRGKEADMDQELVEDFSTAWGFECCVVKADPDIRTTQNVQQWAREFRYQVFSDLMIQSGHAAVITAHHRDDQAETILSKVLGGSSPETWQGMQVFEPPIFRPLLSYSKEQLLAYCDQESVPFRIDSSNQKAIYFRNAIRHTIQPVFDAFSPGWKENLLNLEVFGSLNEKAVTWITDRISKDTSISVSELRSMPEVLALSVIRNFSLKQGVTGLSRGLLNEIYSLIDSQAGRMAELPEGKRIVRDRFSLSLVNRTDTFPDFELTMAKAEKGGEIKDWSFNLRKMGDSINKGDILRLSADRLNWPLYIASWEPGDSFIPFGLKKRKKVADFLTDRKIEPSEKENTLKLTDSDGTIHALLYPSVAPNGEHGSISEHVRVSQKDKRVLTITKINET